jgi:hypothetical protein
VLYGPDFLGIIERACARTSGAEIARASVIGRNEGLFRDLVLNEVSRACPDLLVRAEWDTPHEAFERWARLWPSDRRSKGIVDLIGVPVAEPLSQFPVLGVEFKLWYWFDLLEKSKYASGGRDYHHLISQSFVMDATKLLAVMPENAAGRLIVTIVPTFHFDPFPTAGGQKRADYLTERGFPKSYARLSRVDSPTVSTSAELRTTATRTLADYLIGRECPTTVGGGLTGTHNGIIVTTDFVVTEVPQSFRP